MSFSRVLGPIKQNSSQADRGDFYIYNNNRLATMCWCPQPDKANLILTPVEGNPGNKSRGHLCQQRQITAHTPSMSVNTITHLFFKLPRDSKT